MNRSTWHQEVCLNSESYKTALVIKPYSRSANPTLCQRTLLYVSYANYMPPAIEKITVITNYTIGTLSTTLTTHLANIGNLYHVNKTLWALTPL